VIEVTLTDALQSSVAVAIPNKGTELHSNGLTGTGQVMTGGMLSCTSMVALHEAEFPHPSMAVHVRVKLYSPGQMPGKESVTVVITNTPVHGSVIVGVMKFGVCPHSIGLITPAQVIVGKGFP
jgi:hypothetical protein